MCNAVRLDSKIRHDNWEHIVEEAKLVYERDMEEWHADEALRKYLLLAQPIPRPDVETKESLAKWATQSEQRYQRWIHANVPAPVAPSPPALYDFIPPMTLSEYAEMRKKIHNCRDGHLRLCTFPYSIGRQWSCRSLCDHNT
jgi:hypothetical protein